MIKKARLSLSLINTIFLVVFLIVIVLGIFISVYYSSKRVLNYNINEYANQTRNITDVIIKTEQKNLNNLAIEIADIIKINSLKKNLKAETLAVVDQIDFFFIKSENETVNYSQSLFDTHLIINELEKMNISSENTILSISTTSDEYIMFLSIKSIIDQDTGRVKDKIYLGKILNNNFSILNNIKESSLVEDIYIYYKNELIGTTSNKALTNQKIITSNTVIKENSNLYFKKIVKTYNNESFEIIYLTNNKTLELLKNDFIKIGWVLSIFVLISFGVLYIGSNSFIIKPFSKLLEFANRAKNNKNEIYESNYAKEFDEFAEKLKDVIDELRELKEQYSRAINGVEDGLWDYDLKTKKLFVSKKFLDMLGYKKNESIKSLNFWKDSIHKDDYFKTLRKIANHKNAIVNIYDDNYRFKCSNGSFKWIRIRGKIFYDSNNKAIKVTGVHTDIDEFVKLQKDNLKKEQLLFQQNKLASMGEMIGNIAHQWRQPLNIISTIASTQIIRYEIDDFDKKSNIEGLVKVIDTVNYLSAIIEKFRDFFNPNKEVEEFYIEEMINENMEIFEAAYLSNAIKLIINVENVKIIGFKFELMQVILNVINNSKDAFLSKELDIEKKFIFIYNSIEDGVLLFKIRDNAGGIKDTIKDKIYEPYFTTKHQSQGTGLGLYMSREIIKKHFQGEFFNETVSFEYEGKVYSGEEFTIKIPIKIKH